MSNSFSHFINLTQYLSLYFLHVEKVNIIIPLFKTEMNQYIFFVLIQLTSLH